MEDAVVEVARPGVAAAAGVVRVREVGRRRRHERRGRALAVAVQAVAADAALEEDLLATEEIRLGDRQRIAGQPVAPVDLGEVRHLRDLALGRFQLLVRLGLDDRLVRALEALVRLREALVHGDDVLRVQLARVAQKA